MESTQPMSSSTPAVPSPKPSKWGSAGWWFVVLLSVPFIFYSAIFVTGHFQWYRRFTLNYVDGNHEKAGQNIRHHLHPWQIHAFAAIVFVITGAFQFCPNFRKRNPKIHRCIGYTFVVSAIVLPITGIFFMNPHSEFGRLARIVFVTQGVFLLVFICLAVFMVRCKNFKAHQIFMIRSAGIGYSAVAVRIFIPIFAATGLNFWTSAELGALVSPLVYAAVAELYIQRALKPRQKRMQIHPVDEVSAYDIEADAQKGTLDAPLKPGHF